MILAATAASTIPAVTVAMPGGDKLEWGRGGAPQLLALPRNGEGWSKLAARLAGGARHAADVRAANAGLKRPLQGVRVRIPWSLLAPEERVAAARALFPQDRRTATGWEHVIVAPWGGDGESWWELAEWFCGDGSRYPALRRANPEIELFPSKGTRLVIPTDTMLPEFRRLKPDAERVAVGSAQPAKAPSPRPTARVLTPANPSNSPAAGGGNAATPTPTVAPPAAVPTALGTPAAGAGLAFQAGEAVYRLRPHEALYSAVVVRFTGQLHAPDVNATAKELARRSGIADVTSIPVGYPIHIPFEMLLPEFLPPDNPQRKAWEKEKEELAAIKRVIHAANLDGIHVILDAGHGGGDTGAIAGNVWESTYVFDVMARLRRVLERETQATVWATVQDPALEGGGGDRDVLPQTRDQRLLVDPPYDLAEPAVGVPLRWILANSLLDRLKQQKVDPERVAFVSIHADSLHPAVRGLMVYVPARSLRPTRASVQRSLFACREVAALKPQRFTASFCSRSEALSSQLGEAIAKSAGRFGIPVHPYEPVRSAVLRGGSRWVPAVLKYSLVPTAVLVEICNLNNEHDRDLLLSWRFREKLAHAIAAGLAEGFAR
jgi:N-acetylmuramoyl-L-alanine amidase